MDSSAAMTAFWDPYVRIGLRFGPASEAEDAEDTLEDAPEADAALAEVAAEPEAPAQVVSLDAFRRRPARE